MDTSFLDLHPISYVGIFMLVGFAGFVDAIAGGGGLITIPTYLAFGIPTPFILGTNKFVACIGTTSSVVRYIKNGKVILRLVLLPSAMAFLMSIVGARTSAVLSPKFMVYILLMVIPPVLYFNYRHLGKTKTAMSHSLSEFQILLLSGMIGGSIGFYDGFFGPGTGTFLVMAYVYFLGTTLSQASANGRIVNFASNISAMVTFLVSGRVLFHPITMVAVAGFMSGNWLGSGLVIRKDAKIVRPIFTLVLVLLLLKCLWDIFRK